MIRALLFFLLMFAGLSPGPARAGADGPLIVFAAASLKTALDAVTRAWGGDVTVSYSASSALARQIEYGAPADIVISANVAWMDLLERDGLIRSPSRVALLSNRLVLIAAPGNDVALSIRPGFDLAAALGPDRLAMALVDAVPAGIYGRAALESLGIWDSVAPKVAQSDNARSALALVSTGEAPLGIVYATDARADPNVRLVDTFPEDSHPPIFYPAALTADARMPEAGDFMAFLSGPTARAIFVANGFTIPDPGR